jgi:hypothetical protein
MVSIDEFKKAIGSVANGRSEQEIVNLNERMSRLASVLFDTWNKDMKKAYEHH